MRVAVFCLDPVYSEAMASLLTHSGGFKVVACTGNLLTAAHVIANQNPDVLLFTEEFEDQLSRAVIRELRQKSRIRTALLHAQHLSDQIQDPEFDLVQSRLAGLGALFLSLRSLAGEQSTSTDSSTERSPRPDILERLQGLTVRERETARLVRQGLPNKQIASILGISDATVKLYVGRLLKYFGCRSRTLLALKLSETPIGSESV